MTIHDKKCVPTVVHERDCELEQWNDAAKGSVQWRTLISGDRTATSGLTCGVAEVPVGSSQTFITHRHAPPEIYHILAGQGRLNVDGTEYELGVGSTVFIPGNASHGIVNTGKSPLRLLYVFPVDSFDQVEYVFSEQASPSC